MTQYQSTKMFCAPFSADVNSEFLESIRFDPESTRFDVRMKDGSRRSYLNVPAWHITELLKAKDKRQCFLKNFGDDKWAESRNGLRSRIDDSQTEKVIADSTATIQEVLPDACVSFVKSLMAKTPAEIRFVPTRKTCLGTHRALPMNNFSLITINRGLGLYQTTLTLLHEFAHAEVSRFSVKRVPPHGAEWRNRFRSILEEALKSDLFPESLAAPVAAYARFPLRSSRLDRNLARSIKVTEEQVKAFKNELWAAVPEPFASQGKSLNFNDMGWQMRPAEMVLVQSVIRFLCNRASRGFQADHWTQEQIKVANELADMIRPKPAYFAQMLYLVRLCLDQLPDHFRIEVNRVKVENIYTDPKILDSHTEPSLANPGNLRYLGNQSYESIKRRIVFEGKTLEELELIGRSLTESERSSYQNKIKSMASGAVNSCSGPSIHIKRLARMAQPSEAAFGLMYLLCTADGSDEQKPAAVARAWADGDSYAGVVGGAKRA